MAREVSSLGDHEHDRSVALSVAAATWNVHESSLEISDHETADLQNWSDSDILDTEALVEGPIQGGVKLSAVNFRSGGTLLWDAVDSETTEVTTAPVRLFFHEVSSWLPDDDSCVAFMLSPTREDDEDDHDAQDSGGGMQLKGDWGTMKDCFLLSRVSLKTAPQTSSEAPVSARNALTPVAFSPTSLAEDVVSFLEAESPSPTFHLGDEREDYLMHEDEGSGDEGDLSSGEERFDEVVKDVMAAVPTDDAHDCPGQGNGNVLGDTCANDYEDMYDYIDTQHAFLRKKELELALRSSYLNGPGRPGAVTAARRAALLDWLMRLHTVAPTACRNAPKLSEETLFLSANIFDRFLSIPEAREKLVGGGYNLELAAASALCLAAKFEDVEVPSLWAFAAASKLASGSTSFGNLFAGCNQTWGEGRPAASRCGCDVCEARDQLVRVEELVTSALGFRMMAPTALSFLGIYLVRARRLGHVRSSHVSEKLRSEAIETLWSVVRDASSFNFCPSELAAAALYLASCDASASKPLWFDLLAITGIELKQLQGCLRNMRRVKASAPTRAEGVTHRDSVGGCIYRGTLEHGHGEIRYLGGGCELRGGASKVGGMEEAPGVKVGDGFVGSGSGFGGDACMSGGMEVSEEGEGDGFVDSVLRLGGVETDCGFGRGAPRDGGVEMSEVEVGGGFADSVLRLGGVETNSGPYGADVRGGILEVSVVEVHGAFADSVLRLGGVETSCGFQGGELGAGDLLSGGPAEGLNDFGMGGTEGIGGGSSNPFGARGRGGSRSGFEGDLADERREARSSVSIGAPVNSSGSFAGTHGSISPGGGDFASTSDQLTSCCRSGGNGRYSGSVRGSGPKLCNRDYPCRCRNRDRNGVGVICYAKSGNCPVGDCSILADGGDSTTIAIHNTVESWSGDACSSDPTPGDPRVVEDISGGALPHAMTRPALSSARGRARHGNSLLGARNRYSAILAL